MLENHSERFQLQFEPVTFFIIEYLPKLQTIYAKNHLSLSLVSVAVQKLVKK